MKQLFVIDKKDYDESWEHSVRWAVRAVIFKGDLLAMVYSQRDRYYKFPGGGMERGESHADTLIREVREEVGLSVIPSTIAELGMVTELKKSDYFQNIVFRQNSCYYLCDVGDNVASQHLDDYEAAEGFCLRYVTIGEAMRVNALCESEENIRIAQRENRVLELLAEQCI